MKPNAKRIICYVYSAMCAAGGTYQGIHLETIAQDMSNKIEIRPEVIIYSHIPAVVVSLIIIFTGITICKWYKIINIEMRSVLLCDILCLDIMFFSFYVHLSMLIYVTNSYYNISQTFANIVMSFLLIVFPLFRHRLVFGRNEIRYILLLTCLLLLLRSVIYNVHIYIYYGLFLLIKVQPVFFIGCVLFYMYIMYISMTRISLSPGKISGHPLVEIQGRTTE